MQQSSSPLRNHWTNAILHLSSYIAQKKQALGMLSGGKALCAVFAIIGAELLLLVISLPSYLVAKPAGTDGSAQAFRLRRALTLGTIVTVLIIWILKLLIILFLSWHVRESGSEQIIQTQNRTTDLQTIAHDMLVAEINPTISAPVVSKIKNTHKQITIWGTATPNTAVIFIFTDTTQNTNVSPKLYTTSVDATGNFILIEDETVFNLPAGEYTVSALTYDQMHMQKSADSRTFPLTVSAPFYEWFLRAFDTILNILALIAIIIGILITILVA